MDASLSPRKKKPSLSQPHSLSIDPTSRINANPVVPEPDPIISGKLILVVECDEFVGRTMRDILVERGAAVEYCLDKPDAFDLLDTRCFDLVIFGLKLPSGNGNEIFSRAKRGATRIPTILVTGFEYDPSHSIARATREGLHGVVFKPLQAEEFIKAVRSALTAAQANKR